MWNAIDVDRSHLSGCSGANEARVSGIRPLVELLGKHAPRPAEDAASRAPGLECPDSGDVMTLQTFGIPSTNFSSVRDT